ncbi:MAG: hypothetical protein V4540_18620 [Pseudomonadota bacterium]
MDDAQPGVLEHLVGRRVQRRAEQAPHEAVQAGLVSPSIATDRRGHALTQTKRSRTRPFDAVLDRLERDHGVAALRR